MHTYEFFAPVRREGAIGAFTGRKYQAQGDTPGEALTTLCTALHAEGLELGSHCWKTKKDLSFRVVKLSIGVAEYLTSKRV